MKLSDQLIDQLLEGRVHPLDAPPPLREVARLVQVAKGSATAEELSTRAATVASMVALRANPISPRLPNSQPIPRSKPMISKLLTTKVIAATAAALVISGTSAAAATGSFPSTIQTTLSDAASHVGISLPNPNIQSTSMVTTTGSTSSGSSGSTTTGSSTTSTSSSSGSSTTSSTGSSGSTSSTSSANSSSSTSSSQAKGPDLSGPAKYGLCTAYFAQSQQGATASGNNDGRDNSVAFQQLSAAAKASGESVSKFCASVTPGKKGRSNEASSGQGSQASRGDQSSGSSSVSGSGSEDQSSRIPSEAESHMSSSASGPSASGPSSPGPSEAESHMSSSSPRSRGSQDFSRDNLNVAGNAGANLGGSSFFQSEGDASNHHIATMSKGRS
ncbi:MAG: hypothetical protein M1131_05960 [Actinobacteria bacterium]|nr:hypothetical protein [Actinomycetota bacterium]